LKVGYLGVIHPEPVKPSCEEFGVDGVDSDDEGDDLAMETADGVCERIVLEKEDAVIKKLIDPMLPSEEEVNRHYLAGHVLYRNRCPIYIKAKGREMDHSSSVDKERLRPEYSFDYCFPGDEFGFKWTVWVGEERKTKLWMATTVPVKGSSGKFSTDKC
jgi:hypothetical protein